MKMERIYLLLCRSDYLLLVFYNHHGYQFRVASQAGVVGGEQMIFYTAEAAEREGRNWLANFR